MFVNIMLVLMAFYAFSVALRVFTFFRKSHAVKGALRRTAWAAWALLVALLVAVVIRDPQDPGRMALIGGAAAIAVILADLSAQLIHYVYRWFIEPTNP